MNKGAYVLSYNNNLHNFDDATNPSRPGGLTHPNKRNERRKTCEIGRKEDTGTPEQCSVRGL